MMRLGKDSAASCTVFLFILAQGPLEIGLSQAGQLLQKFLFSGSFLAQVV